MSYQKSWSENLFPQSEWMGASPPLDMQRELLYRRVVFNFSFVRLHIRAFRSVEKPPMPEPSTARMHLLFIPSLTLVLVVNSAVSVQHRSLRMSRLRLEYVKNKAISLEIFLLTQNGEKMHFYFCFLADFDGRMENGQLTFKGLTSSGQQW